MAEFIPANSLEIQLRAVIRDKNTPSWNFYTPLAAAELHIITRNYPELDGSDLVAPEGRNPEVCIFQRKEGDFIGIYTSRGRVKQIFDQWKISQVEYTTVSAKGWQLLRYLSEFDADLWMNAGLKDCQYHLDPDMVEILLSRPEPPDVVVPTPRVIIGLDEEPPAFLDPLREFLAKQPTVRAAWVFSKDETDAKPAYEVGIAATDPEDDTILGKVGTFIKAITPLEVECSAMMLMADDLSLANLSKQQEPYYKTSGFLKEHTLSG